MSVTVFALTVLASALGLLGVAVTALVGLAIVAYRAPVVDDEGVIDKFGSDTWGQS